MKYRIAIITLLILFPLSTFIINSPTATADVTLVLKTYIRNNTISINITVDGTDVAINITNEFVVIEPPNIDQQVTAGITTNNSIDFNAFVDSPENSELNVFPNGFNMFFNTSEYEKNEIYFKYSCTLKYTNISGFNFVKFFTYSREISRRWAAYYAELPRYVIVFNSNIPISVQNGTDYKNGTNIEWVCDVKYSSYDYYKLDYLVRWSEITRIVQINESLHPTLMPGHLTEMEKIIEKELVTIKISDLTGGEYAYNLNGTFILNEVMERYIPVWLWFPNNITNATATLNDRYNCKIETDKLHLYDQKGFYIYLPPDCFFCRIFFLNVSINGQMNETWCDFFIVSKPMNASSIKYILPNNVKITNLYSPFEKYTYLNTTENKVVEFSGECRDYGVVHIDWIFLPHISILNPAMDITSSSIKLSWEGTNTFNFLKYELYLSSKAGTLGKKIKTITDQSATQYIITNLQANTTYYFTVREISTDKKYVDSEQFAVTTLVGDKTTHAKDIGDFIQIISIIIAIVLIVLLILVISVVRKHTKKR
ncbi:MAG: fibronectin type III domain-containing protein [Candidatus Thermoplasmatota archaeon]